MDVSVIIMFIGIGICTFAVRAWYLLLCDGFGSCVMKGARRRAGTCDVCRRRGEQHVEAKKRRESWAASWATSGWAASDLLSELGYVADC